jgi:uncharacterized OB-fold protein
MSETPWAEPETRATPGYDDWRTALEGGTILGSACRSCGHVTGTPKRLCGECGSDQLEGVSLPTTGEVYSETTIGVAPAGFEGPYAVAVVDLDGTFLTARVNDDVEIGDTVRFEEVITAEGRPAPVFAPVE